MTKVGTGADDVTRPDAIADTGGATAATLAHPTTGTKTHEVTTVVGTANAIESTTKSHATDTNPNRGTGGDTGVPLRRATVAGGVTNASLVEKSQKIVLSALFMTASTAGTGPETDCHGVQGQQERSDAH